MLESCSKAPRLRGELSPRLALCLLPSLSGLWQPVTQDHILYDSRRLPKTQRWPHFWLCPDVNWCKDDPGLTRHFYSYTAPDVSVKSAFFSSEPILMSGLLINFNLKMSLIPSICEGVRYQFTNSLNNKSLVQRNLNANVTFSDQDVFNTLN